MSCKMQDVCILNPINVKRLNQSGPKKIELLQQPQIFMHKSLQPELKTLE